MNRYTLDSTVIDSVELKCLLVSRGVKVDKSVYKQFSGRNRLSVNPLACDCMFLSDGTIVQLTDMGFHLKYLTGILSWDNLKLLRYASELGTPFSLKAIDGGLALMHGDQLLDTVSLPPKTDFYDRRTSSGLPFIGNAVLQGLDWVAFQCLWPCEYAAKGQPCEFCFSGGEFQTLAARSKPLPPAVAARDVADIIAYAFHHVGMSGVQITGGSTLDAKAEAAHIGAYLEAIAPIVSPAGGDMLLYITPPEDFALIDTYFALGATRIACSLEVWDEARAQVITPGKMRYTTRQRYLGALEYAARRHGPGAAFSNFIIGIEPVETLEAGATYLAQRGIVPTASIWMPMGRPVMGSMRAPGVDYYRRVKDIFAGLYVKYGLKPPGKRGLNVCMERDIWRYATEQ